MKFTRLRAGYYQTEEGHEIEHYPAQRGNPACWVIRYPGQERGDVSRGTLRMAKSYLHNFPTDS